MKKTGEKKKLQNYLKKMTFGQMYMEFDACHENVKNDVHTTDILKIPQRRKEQVI